MEHTCGHLRTQPQHQIQRNPGSHGRFHARYVVTQSDDIRKTSGHPDRRNGNVKNRHDAELSTSSRLQSIRTACRSSVLTERAVNTSTYLFADSSEFELFVQDNVFGCTGEHGSERRQTEQKHLRAADREKTRLFHRRHEYAASRHVRYPATDSSVEALFGTGRHV